MAESISGLKYNRVEIQSLDGTKTIDLTNSIPRRDYQIRQTQSNSNPPHL